MADDELKPRAQAELKSYSPPWWDWPTKLAEIVHGPNVTMGQAEEWRRIFGGSQPRADAPVSGPPIASIPANIHHGVETTGHGIATGDKDLIKAGLFEAVPAAASLAIPAWLGLRGAPMSDAAIARRIGANLPRRAEPSAAPGAPVEEMLNGFDPSRDYLADAVQGTNGRAPPADPGFMPNDWINFRSGIERGPQGTARLGGREAEVGHSNEPPGTSLSERLGKLTPEESMRLLDEITGGANRTKDPAIDSPRQPEPPAPSKPMERPSDVRGVIKAWSEPLLNPMRERGVTLMAGGPKALRDPAVYNNFLTDLHRAFAPLRGLPPRRWGETNFGLYPKEADWNGGLPGRFNDGYDSGETGIGVPIGTKPEVLSEFMRNALYPGKTLPPPPSAPTPPPRFRPDLRVIPGGRADETPPGKADGGVGRPDRYPWLTNRETEMVEDRRDPPYEPFSLTPYLNRMRAYQDVNDLIDKMSAQKATPASAPSGGLVPAGKYDGGRVDDRESANVENKRGEPPPGSRTPSLYENFLRNFERARRNDSTIPYKLRDVPSAPEILQGPREDDKGSFLDWVMGRKP
jgi:hypothetical protein